MGTIVVKVLCPCLFTSTLPLNCASTGDEFFIHDESGV
jgi:hypothetical protein